MPELIIFIQGVVVTLFAVTAAIVTGIGEAEDLREAGLLEASADGPAPGAAADGQSKFRHGTSP